MTNQDIATDYFAAIEGGDLTRLKGLLADDFVFDHGASPDKVDAAGYVAVMEAIIAGIPDWQFNLQGGLVGNDVVTGTVKITGTHTGTLDLSMMGLPIIEATNKSLDLPAETVAFHVADGKIARLVIEAVDGGGIPGILGQLGIVLPAT